MKPATIVCFPFAGQELGGSHISALGLIRHLDRRRFEPLVVLQHPDSPIGDLFRRGGVATDKAPQTSRLEAGAQFGKWPIADVIADYMPLARFIRQRNIGIVHTNDGRTHATWAVPARLAGTKLVWHHRGNPNAAGLRLAAPALAHGVISVSHFASPPSGLYSAAHKNRVIYSPFDIDYVPESEEARTELMHELGARPGTRVLGYFGSLFERKRPLLFVDAIAELHRERPDLDIVGAVFGPPDATAQAALMDRARTRGVEPLIRWMGFREPGAKWLSACDLLLVPAIGEPFGRTIIEAMIVGTPVVAARSGGNTEAIRDGETGLLVAPEDPPAMAQACARLLDNDALYAAIASNAQSDAKRKFSESVHARAVMDFYEALLAEGRPPAQSVLEHV